MSLYDPPKSTLVIPFVYHRVSSCGVKVMILYSSSFCNLNSRSKIAKMKMINHSLLV